MMGTGTRRREREIAKLVRRLLRELLMDFEGKYGVGRRLAEVIEDAVGYGLG